MRRVDPATLLVVCRVLCAAVVGATSSEGFLVIRARAMHAGSMPWEARIVVRRAPSKHCCRRRRRAISASCRLPGQV